MLATTSASTMVAGRTVGRPRAELIVVGRYGDPRSDVHSPTSCAPTSLRCRDAIAWSFGLVERRRGAGPRESPGTRGRDGVRAARSAAPHGRGSRADAPVAGPARAFRRVGLRRPDRTA